MANETNTSGAAGGLGTATVLQGIVSRIRERAFLASFLYWADLTAKGDTAVTIPRATGSAPTMTAITTGGATEAAAQGNVELTSDSVSITPAPKAVHFTISEWLDATSKVNWQAYSASEAVDTMADDIEIAIGALPAGFSTRSGTTAQDLSIAVMDAAITEYGSNAKKKGEGKGVILLHRQGVGQLRADLTSGVGGSLAVPFTDGQLAQIFGQKPGNSVIGSAVGMFYGFPLFQSSNIGTANAGADYVGCIMARSLDPMNDFNCALGGAWKWMPEVTQHDKANQNIVAYVTRGKQALAVAEISDLLGHGILHSV